jgi:hypothetical protein
MLSIHLRLGLPSGLFPSGFPTNIHLATNMQKSTQCYIYIYQDLNRLLHPNIEQSMLTLQMRRVMAQNTEIKRRLRSKLQIKSPKLHAI